MKENGPAFVKSARVKVNIQLHIIIGLRCCEGEGPLRTEYDQIFLFLVKSIMSLERSKFAKLITEKKILRGIKQPTNKLTVEINTKTYGNFPYISTYILYFDSFSENIIWMLGPNITYICYAMFFAGHLHADKPQKYFVTLYFIRVPPAIIETYYVQIFFFNQRLDKGVHKKADKI